MKTVLMHCQRPLIWINYKDLGEMFTVFKLLIFVIFYVGGRFNYVKRWGIDVHQCMYFDCIGLRPQGFL